jgi:hypothetical protein
VAAKLIRTGADLAILRSASARSRMVGEEGLEPSKS